jgi:hypothetical protein
MCGVTVEAPDTITESILLPGTGLRYFYVVKKRMYDSARIGYPEWR